jgi:hypothetical protein
MSSVTAARRKERMFFFEKKNQKTFMGCRGLGTGARSRPFDLT